MNITLEMAVFCIGTISSILYGYSRLYDKLEQIRKDISMLDKDKISKADCEKARAACTYGHEIQMIKSSVKL